MTQDEAIQRAVEFAKLNDLAITSVKSVRQFTAPERPYVNGTAGGLWVVVLTYPSPDDPEYPMSDYCVVEVEDLSGEAKFFPTL